MGSTRPGIADANDRVPQDLAFDHEVVVHHDGIFQVERPEYPCVRGDFLQVPGLAFKVVRKRRRHGVESHIERRNQRYRRYEVTCDYRIMK